MPRTVHLPRLVNPSVPRGWTILVLALAAWLIVAVAWVILGAMS